MYVCIVILVLLRMLLLLDWTTACGRAPAMWCGLKTVCKIEPHPHTHTYIHTYAHNIIWIIPSVLLGEIALEMRNSTVPLHITEVHTHIHTYLLVFLKISIYATFKTIHAHIHTYIRFTINDYWTILRVRVTSLSLCGSQPPTTACKMRWKRLP